MRGAVTFLSFHSKITDALCFFSRGCLYLCVHFAVLWALEHYFWEAAPF
jgi:hypothetical protein